MAEGTEGRGPTRGATEAETRVGSVVEGEVAEGEVAEGEVAEGEVVAGEVARLRCAQTPQIAQGVQRVGGNNQPWSGSNRKRYSGA
jgi:hypothetical protein